MEFNVPVCVSGRSVSVSPCVSAGAVLLVRLALADSCQLHSALVMTSLPSPSFSCGRLRPCVSSSPCVCLSVRSFSSSPRETVLRWLFPDAELCPLLDNTGTTLQRCQLGAGADPQHTVSLSSVSSAAARHVTLHCVVVAESAGVGLAGGR